MKWGSEEGDMFSVRALTALAVLSEEFCHPVRVLFGYISRFFFERGWDYSVGSGSEIAYLRASCECRFLDYLQIRNTCWFCNVFFCCMLCFKCEFRWLSSLASNDPVVSSLPLLQVDMTKCVVNTDPSFRSHWLVTAVCAFGHYLKATVLYILREKWDKAHRSGFWADWPASVHQHRSTEASSALDICLHSFALNLHWWAPCPVTNKQASPLLLLPRLVSIYC